METSVRSRRNHYQTLGVSVGASEVEIREAFGRKIGILSAHPLGSTAQACIAYETLRDPLRRREHDQELGLVQEPPARAGAVVAKPLWAPMIASPQFNPALSAASGDQERALGGATNETAGEASIQARIAAIAASLEELARPIASEPWSQGGGAATIRADQSAGRRGARSKGLSASSPDDFGGRGRAEAGAPWRDQDLEQLVRDIRTTGHAEKQMLRETERPGFGWRRPVIAAAGLLCGAAAIGGLAGLSVSENVGQGTTDAAETAPALVSVQGSNAPKAPAAPVVAPTKIEPPLAQPKHSLPFPEHKRSLPKRSAKLHPERPATALETGNMDSMKDAAVPAPMPPAEAVVSTSPLPAKVIARTIDRIGYSCGAVATTASVGDAAPGVFRVKCTSGESYEATPVRGRYHFRRVTDR